MYILNKGFGVNFRMALIFLHCFFTVGTLFAGDTLIKKNRPFQIYLEQGLSVGFHTINTGIVTNHGDKVLLDCGGGMPRMGIGCGYSFKKKYEASFSLINEEASIFPDISNGTGSFIKNFTSLDLRYKFWISKNELNIFKIGLSGLYSFNARMYFDFTKIPGRAYEEFFFKDCFGGRPMIEYERLTRKKRWGFLVGLDHFSMYYKIDHVQIDRVPVPLSTYPSSVYIYHFNGNSVSLYWSFNYYFGIKNKR